MTFWNSWVFKKTKNKKQKHMLVFLLNTKFLQSLFPVYEDMKIKKNLRVTESTAQRILGWHWQVQHNFFREKQINKWRFEDNSKQDSFQISVSFRLTQCRLWKSIKVAWRESGGKTHLLPLLLVWGTAPDDWLKLDNEHNCNMFATFS